MTIDNQIPDVIYLQWHDQVELTESGYRCREEVTWSMERIHKSDVRYKIDGQFPRTPACRELSRGINRGAITTGDKL